jgi:hypothetical protein
VAQAHTNNSTIPSRSLWCVSTVTTELAESKTSFLTWNRIVKFLNLADIIRLLRATDFWAGVIVRTATLIGFIIFLNVAGDIVDMNELVFKGMANFIALINPYGQSYTLYTFNGPYSQNYFNYPPFAILFHLPALLWPGPQSLGTIDFMPSFFLLHTFFDFVTYYRLWQEKHQTISKIIWITPFFVFVGIITFMSLPLMLLTLTILNIDNPIRSGVYSVCLAATYQIGAIFIPFLIIYYWQQGHLRQNLLGMIPPLMIVFIFFLWNPIFFVYDLLIHQIGRPPVNWFDPNPVSPYYNRYYPLIFLFMGSIPSIVFNIVISLGIPPPIAPHFAQFMMTLVAILGILSLFYFYNNARKSLLIFLPGILLALLVASTAEGLAHYWILCITLPFLFWRQKGSFSSPSTPSHSSDSHFPANQTIVMHSNKEDSP